MLDRLPQLLSQLDLSALREPPRPALRPIKLPPVERLEQRARARLHRVARPPGPALSLMLLNFAAITHDQLGFFTRILDDYGDEVFFQLGRMGFYALHTPALIDELLLQKHDHFIKDPFARELKELLGEGLLTSEGAHWRRQRKLAAPALKRSQIESYAATMSRDSHQAALALRDGQTLDLWQEMMALTLRIVVETLFGLDNTAQASEVSEAIEVGMRHFDRQQNSLWMFVPRQIPSPARREFARAAQHLDHIVRQMIRDRAAGEPGDDLLWRLLMARDEQGEPMSEAQLRDEAITMFIAGHETTALATTYAFDHLARNPEVARVLHEELDALALEADTPLTFAHLEQLPYTRALIKETLRLSPPAWIISREAADDVELGPWLVPRGSVLVVSPYVMHRDPRYFEEPLAFRPERWLDGTLEKQLPRHVYMPFGGGPRICIGNHFAMMEAMLVVAELARRWRFERLDDAPITYDPVITLRPDAPVMMRAVAR